MMCRILKVIVVAPQDRHLELRRKLASIAYDVVATVDRGAMSGEASGIRADVAVLVPGDPGLAPKLRDAGYKVVAVGGEQSGADLLMQEDELGSFGERVLGLFEAR